MSALQVQNEIGKLQKALLHCPGIETRNYPDGQFNQVFTLRPSNSSFDLEKALAEHRSYSDILKNEGDRKSTRLNSSHWNKSRMRSSA